MGRLIIISRLMLLDTAVFFGISIGLFLLNMLHPGILIASFFADIGGLFISAAFAVLSHWAGKGCTLKETCDLTI